MLRTGTGEKFVEMFWGMRQAVINLTAGGEVSGLGRSGTSPNRHVEASARHWWLDTDSPAKQQSLTEFAAEVRRHW